MIIDQRGAPLGIAIGSANTHDSKLVKATMESFEKPFNQDILKIMAADSAYDSKKIKVFLRTMNFIPLINVNKRRSKKIWKICRLYIDGLLNDRLAGLIIFDQFAFAGPGDNRPFWNCVNLLVLTVFLLCRKFSYEF